VSSRSLAVVVGQVGCPTLVLQCRALFYLDLLACLTSVVAVVAAYARLSTELPTAAHSLATYRADPGVSFGELLLGFHAVGVLVMLLLVTKKAHLYVKYRTQLCLLNRLLRLCLHLLLMSRPVWVGWIMGLGVANRSVSLADPSKALLLLMLHPVAFYMQQAMFILPSGYVAVLQLINTIASLQWSWMLPCVLQHAAANPSNSAGLDAAPLLAVAERACVKVQSWVVLLQSALAEPQNAFPFSGGEVCTGVQAVQTLQIFSTFCFLLLLPVGAVLSLEVWLWVLWTSSSTSIHSSSSSSSSSSSTPASHTGGLGVVLHDTGVNSSAYSGPRQHSGPADRQAATGMSAAAHIQCVPIYYYLLLVPLVLAAAWMLSELLTAVFAEHTDCPAILRTCGIIQY